MFVGTVHPLEGDGVSAALFDHLAKENKGLSSARVCIPSTALFEQGFAKAWYLSERVMRPGEGGNKKRYVEVKKRVGKDCVLDTIKQTMLRDCAESEICAVFLTISGRDVSEKGIVSYFTPPMLKAFLHSQMQKPKGLLQKFVKPRSLSNNVIVCTWSPNFMVTELLRNRHSLSDRHVNPTTRAVTFEADSTDCIVSSVSETVRALLQEQCLLIVQHFLSTDHLQIARMVLYFKVDCSNNLRLLFSSSVRVVEPKNGTLDITSPINLTVKLLSGRADGYYGPHNVVSANTRGDYTLRRHDHRSLSVMLKEGEKKSKSLLMNAVFADSLPCTDTNACKKGVTPQRNTTVAKCTTTVALLCKKKLEAKRKTEQDKEEAGRQETAKHINVISALNRAASMNNSKGMMGVLGRTRARLDATRERTTHKTEDDTAHPQTPQRSASPISSFPAKHPGGAPLGRIPRTAEDDVTKQQRRAAWKQFGERNNPATPPPPPPPPPIPQPIPDETHTVPQRQSFSETEAKRSGSASPPAPNAAKVYAFTYGVGRNNYLHCGAQKKGNDVVSPAVRMAEPDAERARALEVEERIRKESIEKKRLFLRQHRCEVLPQDAPPVADESILLTHPRFLQQQPLPVSPYQGDVAEDTGRRGKTNTGLVSISSPTTHAASYSVNILNSKQSRHPAEDYAASNYRFYNNSVVDVVLPSMVPQVAMHSPSPTVGPNISHTDNPTPMSQQGIPQQQQLPQVVRNAHKTNAVVAGSVLIRPPAGGGGTPQFDTPVRMDTIRSLAPAVPQKTFPLGDKVQSVPSSPRIAKRKQSVAEDTISRAASKSIHLQHSPSDVHSHISNAAGATSTEDEEDEEEQSDDNNDAPSLSEEIGGAHMTAPLPMVSEHNTIQPLSPEELMAAGLAYPGAVSMEKQREKIERESVYAGEPPHDGEHDAAFLSGLNEKSMNQTFTTMTTAERRAVFDTVEANLAEIHQFISELCYAAYSHFIGESRSDFYLEQPLALQALNPTVLSILLKRFRPELVRTTAYCTREIAKPVVDSDNEEGEAVVAIAWPVGQSRPASSLSRKRKVKLTNRQIEDKEARQGARFGVYRNDVAAALKKNRTIALRGYLDSVLSNWPLLEDIPLTWAVDEASGSMRYTCTTVGIVLPLKPSSVLLAKGEGTKLSLLDPFVSKPDGLLYRALRCRAIRQQVDKREPEAPLLPM